MIWVLLQSESPWQRNDAITFFIYFCVSLILGDPGAVSRVGRKGPMKVFITGERAPGYRLSTDHFQKFKRMPAPDWAQKMLDIVALSTYS